MSEQSVGSANATRQCDSCERDVDDLMTTGDRDDGPDVCVKCYFNPGWHR